MQERSIYTLFKSPSLPTQKSSLLPQLIDNQRNKNETEFLPISDEVLNALAQSLTNGNLSELHKMLISKLPKVDLHVHGEAGFLMDIDLARKLAERNHLPFPEHLVDKANNRWLYRGKEDFMQFIKDFREVSELFRTPQDVEEAAYAFIKNCHKNNVIFALPGISWVQCREHMSFVEFNQAYNRAILRGMKDFGDVTICRLRYYLERHIDKDDLNTIYSYVGQYPNPLITTIGLAGAEAEFPLSDFKKIYEGLQEYRNQPENPWYFLTAHMERFSNDAVIEYALRWLDWVAHGRLAADNLDLVAKLIEQGIKFEICPLSDVNVYPNEISGVAQHKQLATLVDAELATLSTDDCAFFGDSHEVYEQVFRELKVSYSELFRCSLNGLQPASLQCLDTMNLNKPQSYKDHMETVELGLAKMHFFQEYWQLLPYIARMQPEMAKRFFAIDLKTKATELEELYQLVSDQPELSKQVKLLLTTRNLIDQSAKELLDKTQQLVEKFDSEYGQQTTHGMAL